jgi:hypothetical protein
MRSRRRLSTPVRGDDGWGSGKRGRISRDRHERGEPALRREAVPWEAVGGQRGDGAAGSKARSRTNGVVDCRAMFVFCSNPGRPTRQEQKVNIAGLSSASSCARLSNSRFGSSGGTLTPNILKTRHTLPFRQAVAHSVAVQHLWIRSCAPKPRWQPSVAAVLSRPL